MADFNSNFKDIQQQIFFCQTDRPRGSRANEYSANKDKSYLEQSYDIITLKDILG